MLFIISVALIVLILSGCILFYAKLRTAIQEINYSFMEEVANQQTISFKARLDGQFEQLKLYSRNFENIDMNDYTSVKKVLNVTNGSGDFKKISIANDIGVVINNDNSSSANIIKEEYFISAMNGKTAISSKTIVDDDGEEILIMAAPIYKNDKIVGVILGTFNKAMLGELFRQNNFDGLGYSFVFNKDGSIIASNNIKKFIASNDNFYEGLENIKYRNNYNKKEVMENIKSSKLGLMEYYVNNNKRIAVYCPITGYDWYLFSAVDLNLIKVQSNRIAVYVMILILSILAILSALFAVIYYYIKKNNIITVKNKILASNDERYKIVNNQMENVIFEYDYASNAIYLSGNIQELVNTESDTINLYLGPEVKKVLSNRGFDLFSELSQVREANGNEFEKEFRYLTFEEKYRWYRIKAAFSYNEKNQPIKIIGSITDIQKQKEETEKLRYKAEIDQLTGVLNKKSVEEYIEKRLAKASKNSIFALYIIDLDNFKGINDNLGHIFGDEVLKDVGFKMKRIFRDNDYLGRIGGDEFLAFLNYGEGKYEDAINVIEKRAEKLCQDFRESYSGENADYKVSASIGIAIYPNDGDNYTQLYMKADKALYNSKKKGKDSYSLYRETEKGEDEE